MRDDDRLITLDEAREILLLEECALHGHRIEYLRVDPNDWPETLLCSRCGKRSKIEPPTMPPRVPR